MRMNSRILLSLALLLALTGCSAVTVETGPRSKEAATSASSDQAGNIRSIWADRFANADPVQAASYYKLFVDSTSGRYLNFAGDVISTWRGEEDRQGRELPPEMIGDMIDRSLTTSQPIFSAYDDVESLGWRHVRDSAYFNPETMGLLSEMHEQYLGIRDFVFNPRGTLQEYRAGVETKRVDLEDLSRRAGEALAR